MGITELVQSSGWKNFTAKLYGFGASIVIIGALFKIMHWPGASLALTAGLLIEAIIFFFSAFEPLHEELDWTLVYPELAGMSDPDEIDEYKKREKELLLRFTKEHPDVVMVREMINTLEKEREEDLAEQRAKFGSTKQDVPPLSQNKVYQELKISLSLIEGKLAAARTRVANQKAKVERLRELVDTVPKIEADLKRLNRDYLIHKKNYEALVDRKESAIISENVEQQANKIKFRTIDPPHVGAEPAGPNRPLFSSAVLLMALAAGGVMAFFLGQIRPVFDTPRVLTQQVGKPVLGTVSLVASRGHRNLRRLEVMTFFIGLSSILCFYVLVVWLQMMRFDVVGKVAGIVARFQ